MLRYTYLFGQGLVYLSLFLPVVLVNTFLFPFITPRNFLFRFLMLLGLGVVTLLWVNYKQLRPDKHSWLTWLVFGVVGAKFISSIFGVNFYNSFWSNYERMEGLITWLLLAVFYALVITVFRTKREWRHLLRVALVPALIVAVYGLGQAWSWDFVAAARQSRIESLLGNAAYVGAYMVIHSGLAVYVWFTDTNKIWRIIALLSLFPFHLAMLYSATRGAILGWFVGLVIAGVLFVLWSESKKLKQIAGVVLAGLLLIVGGLFAAKDSDVVRSTEVLRRMTTITLTENTVQSRLQIWKIAIQGWQEKPIFGWGQDNFNYLFNTYYHNDVGEEWVDRAHNNLLDQLSMGGLVTFVTYLALLLVPFYLLWKRRRAHTKTSIVLISLWAAYIIQNQFVFDSLNTYLLFFVILALIRSVYVATAEDSDIQETLSRPEYDQGFNTGMAAGFGVLIVILMSITTYPAYAANKLAIEAFRNTRISPTTAQQYFEDAIELDSFGTKEIALQTQLLVNDTIRRSDIDNQTKAEIVLMSIDAMERAQEIEPDDVRLLVTLGGMYQTARAIDPAYLEQAEIIYKHALKQSPERLTSYFNLAQIALLKQDASSAQAYIEQALDIDPDSQLAHINLLQIFLQQKNYNAAYTQAQVFEEKFDEFAVHELAAISEAYKLFGDFENAERTLTILVQGDPNRVEAWRSLAEVYTALGRAQEAALAQERAEQIEAASVSP